MTTLIALLLSAATMGSPPDTLTLRNAHRAAEARFPRGAEAEIARSQRDLRLRNLDARFLPSITVGSQATYVSDVAEIGISMPGFTSPSIAKDQYRLGVTVDQLVYDGGLVDAQRSIEQVQAEFAAQDAAVAAYSVRDAVEAAWFGVLMADAEIATLDVLTEDVVARRDQTRAAVDRGVALRSNVDVLSAEVLRIGQQRAAVRARRRGALDALAEWTGWDLPERTELSPGLDFPVRDREMPDAPRPGANTHAAGWTGSSARPEFRLFELSRERLAAQSALVGRRNRPRVAAFADGAVGRPQGMNFFENDIGPFFSVGIRASWTPWDWHVNARERETLALQAEVVSAQEETFDQGLRGRAARLRGEISAIESQLAMDPEIIELRRRIADDMNTKFESGVATATDYLTERNAEHRASLAESQRRIQLAQARAALETLLGANR